MVGCPIGDGQIARHGRRRCQALLRAARFEGARQNKTVAERGSGCLLNCLLQGLAMASAEQFRSTPAMAVKHTHRRVARVHSNTTRKRTPRHAIAYASDDERTCGEWRQGDWCSGPAQCTAKPYRGGGRGGLLGERLGGVAESGAQSWPRAMRHESCQCLTRPAVALSAPARRRETASPSRVARPSGARGD